MTAAGQLPPYAADPDGLVISAVLRADPGLDAEVAMAVMAEVAPDRIRRRRLARGLWETPDLLTSSRAEGPRIVGDFIDALLRAGATGVVPPVCGSCGRARRLTYLDGTVRICGSCGHRRFARREVCSGCGQERTVARRDRHGLSQCARCAKRDQPDRHLAVLHDQLARAGTGLDAGVLAEAVRSAAPTPGGVRKLAFELSARPSLLTGDGAHGSARLLRLLDVLLSHGAQGVVMPSCPWCGRQVPLTTVHEKMRCCAGCPKRLRSAACHECGFVGRTGLGHDGRRLCRPCRTRDAGGHSPCTRCGRSREVRQLGEQAGICFGCAPYPTAVCTVCGRTTPCLYADTDAPRCPECSRRREACSRCGRTRPVTTRTETGAPLCGTCHVIVGDCARCGREGRVSTRRTSGEALCSSCYAKDPDRRQPCADCATITIPRRRGRCTGCAATRRLLELLGHPEASLPPHLQTLFDALADSRPAQLLSWLDKPGPATLLTAIARSGAPVTHEFLDQHAPTAGSRRLRAVLIVHGVLPVRDEHLSGLERWVTAFLDSLPDAHDRMLLDSFATWHHLRRLRRRHSPARPLSPHTAASVRTGLTQSARLLRWLRHRGVSLAECRQHHIDAWLDHSTVLRFTARGFVLWAARTRHIDHPVTFPPMPCNRPYRTLADNDRWRLAHRFLHDSTITTADRVTGLLVLLYGQPVTKIAQLTTNHIQQAADGIRLALGPHPITVPPPLDRLLLALAKHHDATTNQKRWLFPGLRPGTPACARHLRLRLAAHGLPSRRGRNSALIDLAARMPTAVLSETLGIAPTTAATWATVSGSPRAGYAGELGRRSLSTPCDP
ncbi:hypothetical protein ACFVJM_29090 [Streptomyces virginiae]|uniref:hypothetical protein n=1 Tax=Streptomyces virginiae TaxID=1961 RepID=UPI00363D1F5D